MMVHLEDRSKAEQIAPVKSRAGEGRPSDRHLVLAGEFVSLIFYGVSWLMSAATARGAGYLELDLGAAKLALVGILGADRGGCAGSGTESSEENNSWKSSTNEIRTTTAEPTRPKKNRAMITSTRTTPKACITAVWCLNCEQELRVT
jgi:hypothetical protein